MPATIKNTQFSPQRPGGTLPPDHLTNTGNCIQKRHRSANWKARAPRSLRTLQQCGSAC